MIGMQRTARKSERKGFDFPRPPEILPQWAFEEARSWQGLTDFDILCRAESLCSKTVELRYEPLPFDIWGIHIARGTRARIYINGDLPLLWKRFALFHEIYHLTQHRRGSAFWRQTATPLSSFEYQADCFAWAAIWPDVENGEISYWN